MPEQVSDELLELTRRLLKSIAEGDWSTYRELSDPSLTAFEPEALGQLVEGLEFHHFYFQSGAAKGPRQTTMASLRVRLFGDVALVTYVRLDQHRGHDGLPTTSGSSETRVWSRQAGAWKHVHFHRSRLG